MKWRTLEYRMLKFENKEVLMNVKALFYIENYTRKRDKHEEE